MDPLAPLCPAAGPAPDQGGRWWPRLIVSAGGVLAGGIAALGGQDRVEVAWVSWLLLAAGLAVWVAWGFLRIIGTCRRCAALRRHAAGQCVSCGYELRDLERCPECGSPPHPPHLLLPLPTRLLASAGMLCAAVCAGVLGAAALGWWVPLAASRVVSVDYSMCGTGKAGIGDEMHIAFRDDGRVTRLGATPVGPIRTTSVIDIIFAHDEETPNRPGLTVEFEPGATAWRIAGTGSIGRGRDQLADALQSMGLSSARARRLATCLQGSAASGPPELTRANRSLAWELDAGARRALGWCALAGAGLWLAPAIVPILQRRTPRASPARRRSAESAEGSGGM